MSASRIAHFRRTSAAKSDNRPVDKPVDKPWKNKQTGAINKGWKWLKNNQVKNVKSGEIFARDSGQKVAQS